MDRKEAKKTVHLEMRNLKQTELQRLKNRGKKGERLRIRHEKDSARRRTKKRTRGNEKVVRNIRPPETASQKIEAR